MIDIHCHPLPGIDDGAETFEVAVAMCRMAASDGITQLVATPHCNYTCQFDSRLNQERLAELRTAVGETPKLLLGCDYYFSYENIRRLITSPGEFTINHTQYVLAELGDHFVPEQLDRVFYEVRVAGLVPIITHPERNPIIHRHPELIHHWVTTNCLVQVTAQSYLGGFGGEAQRLVENWLDRNLIQFFATDAHDLTGRPPVLSECYRRLAAERGGQVADRLLRENPEAVIKGLTLPPQPEPLGPKRPRRRAWFSFLRR